jgi:hypothetical protein
MIGWFLGYFEHNLIARFMIFAASDESCGRCSPTYGGDGDGVDDGANIYAFMLLDN